MGLINSILGKIGVAALAAGALFASAPTGATAATIYATDAEIITDGPRGTLDGRNLLESAYGEADGKFFELGYDAVVEFQFGTPPGQPFFGPGSLVEITFNNNPNWREAVLIEVGMKGVADSFVAASPNPFINTDTFDNPVFTFDGIFDTVRLTDLTRELFFGNPYDNPSRRGDTGGFDVDAIGVNVVPLPAAGWLMIAGIGGLVSLRRRQKKL